ncbi:MAG: Na(+)-translocating NADH-quinone reductase subunit C [Nitrospirales bacterium]|nr:Na(+)-translocating NADH-quinone reductase subunit C [Nitrospira sp.]MDR4500180.1 Na(+)-translocating NADH-quinone reductase subunit C [Nitrospirales bacterium]
MPNDSTAKTIIVALLLCLVCSVIVSTAAVALKPIQLKNQSLDKKRNILQVAGLYQEGRAVEDLFRQVEAKVVDLASGDYVEGMNAREYDQRKAAKDPEQNHIIPLDLDIAHIKQRAKRATVYLVKNDDRITYYILPVHGYGLWSTLYGFLVLEEDANTIHGLQFYEHAETPGLGGEVDNPNWRAKWPGKAVYNVAGIPAIEVVRGSVNSGKSEAIHQVDGLAGATLTSRGVTRLLQYWMSDQGFGPYLQKARSQRGESS